MVKRAILMKPRSFSFVFQGAATAAPQNNTQRAPLHLKPKSPTLEFVSNRHSTEENKEGNLDKLEIVELPKAIKDLRQSSHNFRVVKAQTQEFSGLEAALAKPKKTGVQKLKSAMYHAVMGQRPKTTRLTSDKPKQ